MAYTTTGVTDEVISILEVNGQGYCAITSPELHMYLSRTGEGVCRKAPVA